jgi:hypothetical protein
MPSLCVVIVVPGNLSCGFCSFSFSVSLTLKGPAHRPEILCLLDHYQLLHELQRIIVHYYKLLFHITANCFYTITTQLLFALLLHYY